MKRFLLVIVFLSLISASCAQTTSNNNQPEPAKPAAVQKTAYSPQNGTTKMVGISRRRSYTDLKGEVWKPTYANDHFLVVRLMAQSFEDIDHWFEDGLTHGPKISDELGENRNWVIAHPENKKTGLSYVFIFVIDKNESSLILTVPSHLSGVWNTVIKLFVPNLDPGKNRDEFPNLG